MSDTNLRGWTRFRQAIAPRNRFPLQTAAGSVTSCATAGLREQGMGIAENLTFRRPT